VERGSLLPAQAAPEVGEQVLRLSSGEGWWVEQILSGALAEPVDDLLDHEEWVLVVEGSAVLEVDGTRVGLDGGDWVRLGPGIPHRVLTTRPGTSWLAVHVPPEAANRAERSASTTSESGGREQGS
jgi:cupin 2 domain-containing protein